VAIVLVDLQPMTALGIATALSALPQPVEVTSVERRETAIQMSRDGEVDLAILDPQWRSLSDGLKFCEDLKDCAARPPVLAFSALENKRDLMYCMLAGVDSFVSSHERPERLVSAVHSTLGGNREWVLGVAEEQQPDDIEGVGDLTPREVEVLWMVRERYTNRHIASSLSISPNTVKNHVAAILRKLGIGRRSELYTRRLPPQ
jgi:DNA-binding NarL/FixJ family response regulator